MYILLNLNHTYFGGAKKGESCKIILPFWLHYGNLPCLSLTATYGAQQRKGNVLLCFHWGGEKRYANVLHCYTYAPRQSSMFVMAKGCVLCEVCTEGLERSGHVYRCDSR